MIVDITIYFYDKPDTTWDVKVHVPIDVITEYDDGGDYALNCEEIRAYIDEHWNEIKLANPELNDVDYDDVEEIDINNINF